MLSAQTISELQEILSEEFSFETSIEEASAIATSLVQYVETLIEIDHDYGKNESK